LPSAISQVQESCSLAPFLNGSERCLSI
jgi:hypothetical protein